MNSFVINSLCPLMCKSFPTPNIIQIIFTNIYAKYKLSSFIQSSEYFSNFLVTLRTSVSFSVGSWSGRHLTNQRFETFTCWFQQGCLQMCSHESHEWLIRELYAYDTVECHD